MLLFTCLATFRISQDDMTRARRNVLELPLYTRSECALLEVLFDGKTYIADEHLNSNDVCFTGLLNKTRESYTHVKYIPPSI